VAVTGFFALKGYFMHIAALQSVSVAEMAESIRSEDGFVPYDELPQFYIDAVISAEDRHFFEHKGFDITAIGRALLYDIRTRSFAQGGSTITQQLAKNEFYTQEKKPERKFAELFTSLEIEKELSKTEIFELYVNSIYFGSGYYGIGSASEGYCGKTPSELTEYECAMLAGLPNAPSMYSPDENPELAIERLSQVLDCMADCGKIDKTQKEKILSEK
jgi:membrane peptidoglycan carboxypeptidase